MIRFNWIQFIILTSQSQRKEQLNSKFYLTKKEHSKQQQPSIFHFTNVRTFLLFTMSRTFEKWMGLLIFYFRKKENVRKMTWIRTHKRRKTPTELKACLGNNIYLLRSRKYDAENHSFRRGSKRISHSFFILSTW